MLVLVIEYKSTNTSMNSIRFDITPCIISTIEVSKVIIPKTSSTISDRLFSSLHNSLKFKIIYIYIKDRT